MFKQKLFAPKTGLFLLIIAGLFLMNINFAEAVEWKTITDLPGLPAGKPVTLDNFIIVLYDFLLSAVGIAAMFMIVIGGFRYLTAAGNAAALSEAKDIIYSALYGLLLAISVWVIVSTINPDLVYLKQPGTTVSPENYNCMLAGTACVAGDNCCYGVCVGGVCPEKPVSCIDPTSLEDQENCDCIDGTSVAKAAGKNCTETCRPNNCLVANMKVGIDQEIVGLSMPEIARRFCIYDSPKEDPIVVPDSKQFVVCGQNSIVGNPPAWWHWNLNGDDGTFDFMLPDPYWTARASFSFYFGRKGCVLTATPNAITCPLLLKVKDKLGNESEDKVFIRILRPKDKNGDDVLCWPAGAYCYVDEICCSGDCDNTGTAPTWLCK